MKRVWKQHFSMTALLVALINATATLATTSSTWNSTTGNWTDGTRWSTAPDYPNNGPGGAYEAIVNGGTVTVDQAITLDRLSQSNGGILVNNDLTVLGEFNWTGGALGGSARMTFAGGFLSPGSKVISGPTVDNSGMIGMDVTFGPANGFEIRSGALNNLAGGTINSPGNTSIQGVFNNSGTVNILSNSFSIIGRPSGVPTDPSGVSSGQFISPSNTPANTFFTVGGNHTFTPSSLIRVPWLRGMATGTGNFQGQVEVSSLLETNGGTLNFAPGATVSTALMKTTGGALNFNYDLTLPRAELRSGSLGGSGNFIVTDQFDWFGGGILGSGKISFVGDHAITATAGSGDRVLGRNMEINGTFDWGQASVLSLTNNAIISNLPGSSMRFFLNIDISGAGSINNAGLLYQNGGTLTSTIRVPFINSGTVQPQTGKIRFAGGYRQTGGETNLQNLIFSSEPFFRPALPVTIDGGTFGGTGVVEDPMINSATISVGAPIGNITVNDSVTFMDTSRLLLDLGGVSSSQHDYLFAQLIKLGGNLELRFLNGFESTIRQTDSFNVIFSNGTPTGAFSNVQNGRILTADGLGSFKIVSNSTGVVLSDYQAVPEPCAAASFLLAGIIFFTRRRLR